MDSATASIFDLSPSEKLQLVEDLWDDLASSPEDIPIQKWQKKELKHRKENFEKDSSPALTWKNVKQYIREQYNS